MSDIMKCAIIGLGNIASDFDDDPYRKMIWSHAKAYVTHDKFEIVAVCDSDPQRVNKFKNKWEVDCSSYSDVAELMKIEAPDVISICTPFVTHYDIIKILAEHTPKAILCEKPIVETVEQAKEIIQLCKDKSIVLAVNYMRRWDKTYTTAKDMIDNGEIGKLRSIVAHAPTAMMTSSSHVIDLMCMYGGRPTWVSGDIQTDFVRDVHGNPDVGGAALIRFPENIVGHFRGTNFPSNYIFEIDLIGDGGRIRMSDDGRNFDVWKYTDTPTTTGCGFNSLEKEDNFVRPEQNERLLDALDDILDAIKTKKEVASSGDTSLVSLEIIEAIKKSAQQDNKKVYL